MEENQREDEPQEQEQSPTTMPDLSIISIRDDATPELPKTTVLPPVLVEECFTYLPVRALVRNRCLSHHCSAAITDPRFVYAHLARTPKNRFLGGVMEEDGKITVTCFERVTGPPPVINELLSFRETFDAEWTPLTSCNGLLLWAKIVRIDSEEKGCGFKFTNLATKQIFVAPLFPCRLTVIGSTGFGYDAAHGTYKLVVLIKHEYERGSVNREHVNDICAYVYNLGSDKWRCIGRYPKVDPVLNDDYNFLDDSFHKDGTYLAGTINWLATTMKPNAILDDERDKLFIASINLETEHFSPKNLPIGIDLPISKLWGSTNFGKAHLGVLKGQLCFSYISKRGSIDIWILENFDSEESWMLLTSIALDQLQLTTWEINLGFIPIVPLEMFENSNVLVLLRKHYRRNMVFYDHVARTIVGVHEFPESAMDWIDDTNFTESLVSASG